MSHPKVRKVQLTLDENLLEGLFAGSNYCGASRSMHENLALNLLDHAANGLAVLRQAVTGGDDDQDIVDFSWHLESQLRAGTKLMLAVQASEGQPAESEAAE